jgi:hypothetical protein
MTSTSGTPRPEAGAPGGATPTKGSVVSNVEPEGASAAARQGVGAAQFDAELADELAVHAAHNRRIAADDAVANASGSEAMWRSTGTITGPSVTAFTATGAQNAEAREERHGKKTESEPRNASI